MTQERPEQDRLDFLFRNLGSGRTSDEIYGELDKKIPATQVTKKVVQPIARTVPPAKKVDSPKTYPTTPQPVAPRIETRKPGTFNFLETDHIVRGISFDMGIVRHGVIIGDLVLMRYLGLNQGKIEVGFWGLGSDQAIQELGGGFMVKFRRYEVQTPSGFRFLTRVASRYNPIKKAVHMAFAIDSAAEIIGLDERLNERFIGTITDKDWPKDREHEFIDRHLR